MRATAADVQTIMQLIRLEDTSTETTGIITRHVGAAEIFLRNAGGIEPDYTNDMYLDLVAQYVGIKYDAPEGVGGTFVSATALGRSFAPGFVWNEDGTLLINGDGGVRALRLEISP